LSPPPATWLIPERQPEVEAHLQRELAISSLLAAVLVARGYTEPGEAEAYLHPRLEDLHDPATLPDFEAAFETIRSAIDRKERIYIHGDYDVDGVTSAALLQRFLKSLGADVIAHVPHRMREGYGIHLASIQEAKEFGARLFLTCDCGTSAVEQVIHAHAAGMRVVVTDHHEIGSELPPAEAVVNPHRKDSAYPFPLLAGAGVAFKLAMGMAERLGFGRDKFARAFLDLAALGTVVDMVELTGENRIIGRFGLEQIAKTKKVGLRALLEASQLAPKLATRALDGTDLGFVLGPRLNAAGRVDDAALALELLTTEDVAEARRLAGQIEALNDARKEIQAAIVKEVADRLAEMERLPTFIVAGAEGWHRGVVGIAAGKVVNQFNRPTIILEIDPVTGTCRGSARSIPDFNIAEAIWAHPELMKGGGHAAAAGCSFDLQDLPKVAEALDRYAFERLTPEQLAPKERFDVDPDPGEVTAESLGELSLLEPCGSGNPRPRFAAREIVVTKSNLTRDEKHVQLWLRKGDGRPVKAIFFGGSEQFDELKPGNRIDVRYQPEINVYQGRQEVQWKVFSARPAP
jgi:single-stranded-DNA-specific exonuclease